MLIHETFWGWMFTGIGLQHCWFRPKGGGKQVMVIQNSTLTLNRRPESWPEGSRCDRCGTVVIMGER